MFEEFRNVKGPSRAIHRSIGYNLALVRREKVGVGTGEHGLYFPWVPIPTLSPNSSMVTSSDHSFFQCLIYVKNNKRRIYEENWRNYYLQ